ncbi:MAG: hypothetical protein JWO52_5659 [Gammaproteobacteria bacterium]|jgi:hypothetical protein|nr:hypothetical protein [Gammaproteobacteria bacterium]
MRRRVMLANLFPARAARRCMERVARSAIPLRSCAQRMRISP